MAIKKPYLSCLDTVKPVRDALDVINGKWKLPIIISVGVGNQRFIDVQESIPGITPKALAKELKYLEQNQLIKRIITDDYPVKVTYRLTSYAATLKPVIEALKDWGSIHRKKIFNKD
jgi:DNA-binding HxlR family transcriptional regulator